MTRNPFARTADPTPPSNLLKRSGENGAAVRGAAPRPASLSLASILAGPMIATGQQWFRNATRDELERAAEAIVDIDRDRALVASALLAWKCAGGALDVHTANCEQVSWSLLSSDADKDAFAHALIARSPTQARVLWRALQDALETYDADVVAKRHAHERAAREGH